MNKRTMKKGLAIVLALADGIRHDSDSVRKYKHGHFS